MAVLEELQEVVLEGTIGSLIRANHSKEWDAKPLAYVLSVRDRVAGLPGEPQHLLRWAMFRARLQSSHYLRRIKL